MNKLTFYIYGAGSEYNRLFSYLSLYKEKAEILGVVTTDRQSFDRIDGIPCIRPDEMDTTRMDYIIIAVQNWKEIYSHLQTMGISDEKIIRSHIFYLPYFNLDAYLKLKKSNVSILANTCLGGRLYKELGLKTLSPTINAGCLNYLAFLKDYTRYLNMELTEFHGTCPKSALGSADCAFMPKGILGNEIVWYFPHTSNAKDILEKWNRKRKTVNFDNIAILMAIRSDREAEEFDSLPVKKKLGFYYKDLRLKSVLYCPEWNDDEIRFQYGFNWAMYIHRRFTNMEGNCQINWINFLNGCEDFLRLDTTCDMQEEED